MAGPPCQRSTHRAGCAARRGAEQQIAATYAAFFGRAPDAAGLDFWVNQFNTNVSAKGPATNLIDIASSFGISDEARALYPLLANRSGAGIAKSPHSWTGYITTCSAVRLMPKGWHIGQDSSPRGWTRGNSWDRCW